MAEIGLGKGAGAGSFAAGFGKGLSQALVMNRERSDKKDLEAQRQREELFGKLLPIYLQSGVDPADLEPILQQTFPKQFQQAKGGKKGGESPFQKLAGLLGPIMGMHRGTTIESGWPGGPVTMGPGGHVGMDSPEQGGITGMLGRSPGPFGRQPEPQMAPSQQPEGVTGGTLGNRPVYGANQGAFTTQLSPSEEAQFQNWVRANNIADVDHPDSFYDYRGYWKEYGNKPIRFGVDHFPDTYKQPGHPTFSVESKYAQGRTDAGRWEGEKFIPPTPTGGFAGLLQGAPPDISQTPFGGAQAAPAPQAPAAPVHRTLFGVPMLTEEESAKRAGRRAGIVEGAKTEAELTARMDIARRLIAQGVKPSEAYDRAGLRSTTTGATTVRYGGILKGDQAAPGTDDIYGRPLDPNTYYRLQIQPDMSLSYTPTVAPGGNLGVDREAIARAKFGGKAFAQLTPEQQQTVLDEEVKRAGEKTATTTGARIEQEAKAPLTTKQKFDALMSLQDDWRKADNPAREMQRQLQLMETGLKRAKADPVGGSQAVLVTFQKILDPTSVVRESEYARSGAGLALMDRLQGMVERYSQGGAGVPLPVLEQMTETARQFLAGMQDWNDIERERIGSTAKDAGINPERVFGVAGAKSTTPPPAERGGTATPTGHKYTYDPATGQWK